MSKNLKTDYEQDKSAILQRMYKKHKKLLDNFEVFSKRLTKRMRQEIENE